MKLKSKFVPNDRDQQILQLVYEHRYMSLELLAALLLEPPSEGRKYGFTLTALRARCQKLRENKYLTWQFLADQPTGRGYRTERPAVYSIGPASVDLFVHLYRADPAQIKASIKKNVLSSHFLRHFLAIAKFRVCLMLACQQTSVPSNQHTGVTVTLGTWLQEGLKDYVTAGAGDSADRIPVVPDAVFNLLIRRKDGSTTLSHYALELDRGTMPQTDIARKARGFWHYVEKGLHRRRYTYAGESGELPKLRLVLKDWNDIMPEHREMILKGGIKTLQVLFVTSAAPQDLEKVRTGKIPDRQRQRNMVEAVRRVGDIHPTSSRFLFCTEDLDYDLDRPGALFDSIWQTINANGGLRGMLPALD